MPHQLPRIRLKYLLTTTVPSAPYSAVLRHRKVQSLTSSSLTVQTRWVRRTRASALRTLTRSLTIQMELAAASLQGSRQRSRSSLNAAHRCRASHSHYEVQGQPPGTILGLSLDTPNSRRRHLQRPTSTTSLQAGELCRFTPTRSTTEQSLECRLWCAVSQRQDTPERSRFLVQPILSEARIRSRIYQPPPRLRLQTGTLRMMFQSPCTEVTFALGRTRIKS